MRKKHLVLLLILLFSLFRPHPAHAVTTHLRVGFNKHQAPYHFVDESGNAVGMHIDMLEYVARQAGYELEYFPMETGSKCVESLNKGQIDLALVIKERYPNNPWVSDPISEEIICSLVKNGVESSSGQRIAVFQLGTLSPVIFSRLDTSYAFPVSDQEVALQYLIDEKASIMIGLKESILYYLPQEQTVSGMYTIESNQISMVNYALLVQKNDNALLLALNRHISAMRLTSEYSQIRQNWSYQEPENDRMEWLRYLVTILAIAVIIIGLYAIVDSSMRRALRIQVDKQTLALQQANQEILQNMEQLKSESDMRNRVIRYSYLGMVLFDHEYNVKLINDSALALAGLQRAPTDVRDLPVFNQIILACGEDGTLNGVPEEGAPFRVPGPSRWKTAIWKVATDTLFSICCGPASPPTSCWPWRISRTKKPAATRSLKQRRTRSSIRWWPVSLTRSKTPSCPSRHSSPFSQTQNRNLPPALWRTSPAMFPAKLNGSIGWLRG